MTKYRILLRLDEEDSNPIDALELALRRIKEAVKAEDNLLRFVESVEKISA